jgi:MFS superfamily sulfate permease-like transporter
MKPEDRVESCNVSVAHMTGTCIHVSSSSEVLVQVSKFSGSFWSKVAMVTQKALHATYVDVIMDILER